MADSPLFTMFTPPQAAPVRDLVQSGHHEMAAPTLTPTLLFDLRETHVVQEFREAVESTFHRDQQSFVFSALHLLENIYRPHDLARETRKDDWPAISHPIIAATRAITQYHIDDPEIIVGILYHDEVEVGHLDPNDLNRFGERVKSLVESLTNPKFGLIAADLRSNGDSRQLGEISNQLYRDHVWDKMKDPQTFLAKTADLDENFSTVHRVEDEAFQRKCLQKWLPVAMRVVSELRQDPPERASLFSEEVRIALAERFQARILLAHHFLTGKMDRKLWRYALAQQQSADD